MPRGTSLTAYERGKIDAKREQGLRLRAIARSLHRSLAVVQNYVNNPEEYGTKRRSGRPSKVSAADKRRLVRHASNAAVSANDLRRMCDLAISKSTVLRTLHSSKVLQHRKMKKMPRLTDTHKELRVRSCEHWLETGLQWDRVVYSDEKKFNLDGPDGNAYYWHDLRKEEKIFSKRGSGGGSLMVWGCFGLNGARLATISGRMNSESYTSLLESELQPFGEELGGPNWIFQQDNAPVHDSNFTHAWLLDHAIQILPWPSCSPDLNPIENLWGLLVRKVYEGAKQYDSVQELHDAIFRAWSDLDVTFLHRLIAGMRRRLLKVIEKRGGSLDN